VAETTASAPTDGSAPAPGYRHLPLTDAGSPRPRRRRHAVAAALIAGYLLAAVVVIPAQHAVAVPQWLALHLLLLGAATNAVFVWSRHFAQALLHARPGSESPAHLRLGVLNAGVVSVLTGVAAGWMPLAIAGATLVITAVIAHVASLIAMARAATLPGRLRIAVRCYVAGGIALAFGASLGAVLASHATGSDAWERAVVLTHAHLNVLGWLGLSVIGTQFMLWPAVLRTRMAEDAPAVARRVLVGASVGLAIAVTALLLSPEAGAMHWMAAAGIALYAGSVAYSLKPAVRELRASRPRSAPAWALLLGNTWLITALGIDVAGLASGLSTADSLLDHVLVPVLGIGVVAQILTGALSFLLPVTVGGGPAGNRKMSAVLAYAWPARAALGNAGVAILAAADGPAWRAAGWIGVLTGFGSFPLFLAAALVAVRRNPSLDTRGVR
jgi:nitrite reductase (NO-forming)